MYKIFLIVFLSTSLQLFSQTEDAWVYFNNKPQSATFLSNPLLMLSQRALDRRARHNISLDVTDVPIDANYLNQIKNAPGITYKAKSKWLNAVHVQGSQADIENLMNFGFVEYIEFANKNIGTISSPKPFDSTPADITNHKNNYDYGSGFDQIHQLNGETMHERNFTGQGVLLAVIDAGFTEVDTAGLFQPLYLNNKIKDVYNFVSRDDNVYQFSMHGSGVLSTIVSGSNGTFVGTAPDVEVALYVSEDVSQEMPVEETYWAEAAERADSLGVDVINTSLGYQTYDRTEYSYTMNDLDGQTSFISRAANIAVSRGIVVVVSAGNSGNTAWPKIGMPADAPNVITVGAVDFNGYKTLFSSVGPTEDGRIKPDVMALGSYVTVYWNGSLQSLSGTSFASPIIAGMTACMIQAFPEKIPAEIKLELLAISDRYTQPDDEYGYGIPDFSLYDTSNAISVYNPESFLAYPNPATDFINVSKDIEYRIHSLDGKLISAGSSRNQQIDVRNLSGGIYYLTSGKKTIKIIIR